MIVIQITQRRQTFLL